MTGGRGARGRIMTAAHELFYERGVANTGVAELAAAAEVSSRTLYQHFASKDELVAAYLRQWDAEELLANEAALVNSRLTPHARLLALFRRYSSAVPAGAVRGCPFHNAAVELPRAPEEIGAIIREHKKVFLARLTATCRELGAARPAELAQQLAVLHEGITAWSTSTGALTAYPATRKAAGILIEAALSADQP